MKRLYRSEVTVVVYHWADESSPEEEAEEAAADALQDGGAWDTQVSSTLVTSGGGQAGIPYGDPPTPGDERTVGQIVAAMSGEGT